MTTTGAFGVEGLLRVATVLTQALSAFYATVYNATSAMTQGVWHHDLESFSETA